MSRRDDLIALREDLGLSRERTVRALDPPPSTKTLERWEKGSTPIPGWREAQLRRFYTDMNGVAA